MADISVRLSDVTKSFGGHEVIKGISLEVEKGELVVFVGPSGCGKSTLLRLIAGLDTPTSGSIQISGQDVTFAHPSKRGVAMVFQSYALYPHMTVEDNIGFALKIKGMSKIDVRSRVARAADILQLTPLLKRLPKALSGGQRQRVAIGRAIVREPDVFLFDEPLSNLDASLRGQMRVEIARLHANLGATSVYVTHDQVEAMTLASKIVVLNGGRIEQIGSPLELYRRPANLFVAGFIGSPRMNMLPATLDSSGPAQVTLATAQGPLTLPRQGVGAMKGGKITLGLRPEHIHLAGAEEADALTGCVHLVERLGGETFAYVTLDGFDAAPLIVRLDGESDVTPQAEVRLSFDHDRAHLFGADGKALGAPVEAI
ncbi:sn-glycerol-3-phosphate ABC transporter ATP-binding protein UgpC [Asticcacaulis sp. EMRT-3]|uniref:ABC transporter ATP-binding protein n=1 Tax=Asticcacaulis sp. EMRT-3 TaxID=3040349 RepID=UPI0024AF87D1|nr:sn-glycerol-3-phosphate ABC transporter ATP-binding protein UgpC [Asticcacaulis sp. EMRT-3]MDI7776480.1 sn-glycerol-3-phosphate ABC transporter ATP-binding protein UgpC [Asticcacaulis sp. EMRT-3]